MQQDVKEYLEKLESRLAFNENYIDELNESYSPTKTNKPAVQVLVCQMPARYAAEPVPAKAKKRHHWYY